jgi:hypothetical protein
MTLQRIINRCSALHRSSTDVSFMPLPVIVKINYRLKYSIFLLLFSICAQSQNVTVRGKAHESYAGRIIEIHTLNDFITQLPRKEGFDTIRKDGFFQIDFFIEYIQPVIVRIGHVTARLYVQPDFVYSISFPEIDEKFNRNNDADLFVNIGIIGADSSELNVLTYDYQEMFNKAFTSVEERFFSRNVMFLKADSLKLKCDRKYRNVKNPYFKSYYDYSIASVNASLSRGENYLINSYILFKPIQYRHFEYMQFFNSCFSGYLNSVASSKKGQSLYHIINVKADYNLLDNFLKDDKFLKNDSLRELVIIKNLWDFHYSADFSPDAIEAILSELSIRTKISEHKKILDGMLSYFNKMQPGSAAPDFVARTKTGTIGVLNAHKKRWVYLNFFSTRNVESMREMPKIAALKKKFGDKVSFISICVDDSISTYISYIKSNPKLDWAIWYNYDQSFTKTAKDQYYVTGSEAYFLIDPQGYLVQSPAKSPSQGIEYRLNVLFKPATKNTRTGIR